jgi:hypothetical protein
VSKSEPEEARLEGDVNCFRIGSFDGCCPNGDELLNIGTVKLSQYIPGQALRAPEGRDRHGFKTISTIDPEMIGNPITDLDRACGFQEVKDLIFQDNRQMKVVRLSAKPTGLLYHPGIIFGTHFC